VPVKAAVVLAILGVGGVAHAQSSDDDRFFVDKEEADGGEDRTLWQGSLTSTSFLFREAAGISDPLTGGQVGFENAAPLRWFTDLRAQLDAIHLAGKTWDARVDARARMVNTIANQPGSTAPDPVMPQSGAFGGNEYELRDLYVVRGSVRTDLTVGRQTVLDIAGIKIDGARFDYAKNRRWTYLGFAGLYPTRGSRSITTDYPVGADGKRVMPVAGGGGAAYRTQRSYGAIGAAAIVPLARDMATDTLEQPRVLVTSNGYWRRSGHLDVFHYAVVDLIGAGGFAITNGSLGVNYRPQPRLHVNGTINHLDTEALNVQAQTQLLDPADTRPNSEIIQNNLTVRRISSDSARVSVSAALGKTMRFEATVAGAARRRPQIILDALNGGDDQIIPAAQSGEIFFQAVDRRFYGGLRLAANFVRVFGLGGNANRSTASIFTVTGNREFKDGQGEWEATLGYLASKDDNRGVCSTADLETCYGSSSVRAITASGTGFYRLKADWFVMGTLELARRSLTTLDAGTPVANPAVISTTAFVRIAYRF
jgi:hypothetical protein